LLGRKREKDTTHSGSRNAFGLRVHSDGIPAAGNFELRRAKEGERVRSSSGSSWAEIDTDGVLR
jgi:hypothetical protein